jgi:hypothetical protein
MHYDEEMCETPQDILEQAKLISSNLLPNKSKDRYELEYSLFCKWRNNKNITKVNDDVMYTCQN